MRASRWARGRAGRARRRGGGERRGRQEQQGPRPGPLQSGGSSSPAQGVPSAAHTEPPTHARRHPQADKDAIEQEAALLAFDRQNHMGASEQLAQKLKETISEEAEVGRWLAAGGWRPMAGVADGCLRWLSAAVPACAACACALLRGHAARVAARAVEAKCRGTSAHPPRHQVLLSDKRTAAGAVNIRTNADRMKARASPSRRQLARRRRASPRHRPCRRMLPLPAEPSPAQPAVHPPPHHNHRRHRAMACPTACRRCARSGCPPRHPPPRWCSISPTCPRCAPPLGTS